MKITKFGHACLLVEEQGVRIIIDPGSYSVGQNDAKNIDLVLITHEHQDHMAPDSLRAILVNNPGAVIYTNRGVAVVLEKEKIDFKIIDHGQRIAIKGISFESFGQLHAPIYPGLPVVANTGYMIADRLFHPGDSYYVPERPVEILALPTGGPWYKLSESIDYARAVQPKAAFPVHDAMYKDPSSGYRWALQLLVPLGINFTPLENGGTLEFD